MLRQIRKTTQTSPSDVAKKYVEKRVLHLFLLLFNTTLHDYLSYATITTSHYTAKPTYRNSTYIVVILLN